MPLMSYPEDRTGLADFRAVDYRPDASEEEGPSAVDLLGAAFRQDNLIGSSSSNRMAGIDVSEREDGFTGDVVWNEIQGTPYEDHWDRFATVFNRRAFEAMKSQIDMEQEDRRTLAAGGWAGVAASFGASLADPTMLMPGGAIVKGITTGRTVLKTALAAGKAGALAAGVAELGLQATQETRPVSESALAVGGGALLGGFLGAGAGALFSKAERAAAMRSVEKALREPEPDNAVLTELRAGMAEGQSAGAAAVERDTLEDLSIQGMGAKVVGKATAKLNPVLRAAQSPSAVHRSIIADMAETGFYLEKNVEGRGNIAVESAVKYWDRGALSKGLTDTAAIYKDARAKGLDMTPAEFRQAVSRAMRRGDVGANEAVTRAAQTWRAALFDPLKDAAIEAGLLPPDVHVSTATSYLTRLWNSQRLNANEARFKSIVRPWLADQIAQIEFKADEIRLGNRIVDAEKKQEAFGKATDRLETLEDRLAERAAIRTRKVRTLEQRRATRQGVIAGQPPAELVKMFRGADETGAMVETVKQARAAARSANRQKSFTERQPVLALIRKRGGVRTGSNLAGELRAMGVTPQTHPGLFHSRGGLGDVDNFVRDEEDIFANLPDDGNGYVDRNAMLEAIRAELAGNPLRSPEQMESDAIAENIEQIAAEWLDKVGLPGNATVKEVRDFIAQVTGAEQNLAAFDHTIARLEREIEDFDTATDKLLNERQITDAEARSIREEMNALEAEIEASREIASSSPRVSLVVDYATAKRDIFKAKLSERTLRRRVDALRRLEAEGTVNDEMLAELAAKEIDLGRLGATIEGLKAKADKLEPMVPKIKRELPEFVSEADRADYVNQIADDIFRQLTGRASQGLPSYDMTIAARGPLKERTFNIPDDLVEDFLESDVELIARRYARVMAADVELAKKFGKPTLGPQLKEVANDYQRLRDAVTASTSLDARQKEKALLALAQREKRDVNDIAGVRDLLRGQYKVDSQHTNFARVLHAAQTFNYMRLLGGVLFSSLSDAVRPVMVHGMGRYMTQGIAPLVTNLKAVKLSVKDAKLLGAVTERVLQSRLATMAELADPYAMNSPFERFLANASNVFSRMTLLPFWNDMHKSIASVLTQNRILENALSGDYAKLAAGERKYMGFLGIDEFMAERIAKQFREFGEVEGNVHIPGVEQWTDDGARRAFAAALNKDVDSIIVTKGVADVPLFMNTPAGKALGQFKSFAIASNQRVLMRGLQDGPGSIITGMVGMAALGMLTYWVKQRESGREVSDNPGTWIAEGLDRSGIFSVGFEINNIVEKLGGPGAYWLGAKAFSSKSQQQPASRYATRNAFGAMLGPTFQLGTDTATLLGLGASALHGNADPTPGDVSTMFNMIPGRTLPYWRWIIEGGFGLDDGKPFRGVKPTLQDAVR